METGDSFDLNLLRIVAALDRTRHVGRAAEQLNMSQSGFSSALLRLRRHTGDPLFIRTTSGMMPTPRARQVIEAANQALMTVNEGILQRPTFDPRTTRTRFTFAMTDLGEPLLLPALLERFQNGAPGASVRSSLSLPPDLLRQALANGEVDLAIGYYPELLGESFMVKRLFTQTFACIIRRKHPLAAKTMTVAAYAKLGHVAIIAPSRAAALLEVSLQRRGIRRRIVLETQHHLSLAAIVEATDLIATIPHALAVWFAREGRVKVVPLPFPADRFEVQRYWHRRYDRDPQHRWLREQVDLLFGETAAGSPAPRWRAIDEGLYGKR